MKEETSPSPLPQITTYVPLPLYLPLRRKNLPEIQKQKIKNTHARLIIFVLLYSSPVKRPRYVPPTNIVKDKIKSTPVAKNQVNLTVIIAT